MSPTCFESDCLFPNRVRLNLPSVLASPSEKMKSFSVDALVSYSAAFLFVRIYLFSFGSHLHFKFPGLGKLVTSL